MPWNLAPRPGRSLAQRLDRLPSSPRGSARPRPRAARRRSRAARRRESSTSTAPTFSSRRARRLVPGIGTMSSPCASTHASASCAGVTALSAASSAILVTRSRLRWKFSPWKRGREAPVVVLVEVVDRLDGAGQEAAAERRVGDEADAQLAARRQDLVLGLARPQRVLGLQRGDRVHRVGAAQRVGRGLAEAEVADLALLRRARPCAPTVSSIGVLGVDAVLVVEVDVVDAQAPQRGLGGLLDVLRACRSTPRAAGSSGSRTMPNLVASTTSSRRSAIARPTSSSLVCGP